MTDCTGTENEPAPLSYPARLREIAAARPDAVAIRWVPDHEETCAITYSALYRAADRLAQRLLDQGAHAGSMIGIVLPNGIPFFVALIAAWRIGACPTPIKPDMTDQERAPLMDLIRSPVLICQDGGQPGPTVTAGEIAAMMREAEASDAPATPVLPDIVPQRCWAIASGGSTGTPKIIVNLRPASMAWQFAVTGGPTEPETQLVCLPLYHTSALSMSVRSLLAGDEIILLPRFNAVCVADAIEHYRVALVSLVSAAMVRLARLPELTPERLASVRQIITGGGAFSDDLLREWSRLVGAEKILFGFGASEAIGACAITGDELLKRPGCVGKPTTCDVRILDEDGSDLPAGEVGEIYMRNHSGDSQAFDYLGRDVPRKRPDGFVSVGDVGWLDADGYLYISDRRTDMIKTGGVNVFPAEVEAALVSMPEIVDAVVLGLPDPDWGRALHAVVVGADPQNLPDVQSIRRFLRARLTSHKVPKTFEFLPSLGRTDTLKLNRRAMTEERIGACQS